MKAFIGIVVLVGFLWFSYFAFETVNASQTKELTDQIVKEKEKVAILEKRIGEIHEEYKSQSKKHYDALVFLYPEDKERILHLFYPPVEEAAEEATEENGEEAIEEGPEDGGAS